MSQGTANFFLGAIIGALVAVLIIYWKQIQFLQQNSGTIGDVANIVQSGQNLIQKL